MNAPAPLSRQAHAEIARKAAHRVCVCAATLCADDPNYGNRLLAAEQFLSAATDLLADAQAILAKVKRETNT
jgi:hypothetical protein